MEHKESITGGIWPILYYSGNYGGNINRRTRDYIKNNLITWSIEKSENDNQIIFEPKEFKGDEVSLPFKVILNKISEKEWSIYFGNISKDYTWYEGDPFSIQKLVFLIEVFENKITPLIIDKNIHSLIFDIRDVIYNKWYTPKKDDYRYEYFQDYIYRNLDKSLGFKYISEDGLYKIYKDETK